MSLNQSHTAIINKAFSFYKNGQFTEAKALCLPLLKEAPKDPGTWCLMSSINCALGLNREAEQNGKHAIKLSPAYTLAYYYTAVALFNQGKTDSALSYFNEVIQKQPEHGMVHFLMGKCYEKHGNQNNKAIACYEQAMQLLPTPPRDMLLYLGYQHEKFGNNTKARRCLEQLLERTPMDPEAVRLIANLDASEGRLDSARSRLEAILGSDTPLSLKERAPLVNRLGLVLDRLGEFENAFETFEKTQKIVAEYAPQHSGAYWLDRIDRNKAATTPNNVATRQTHTAEDGLPAPIFLVGFPRSGTTLTERIIASHPNVTHSDEATLIEYVINKLNKITANQLSYPENLNDLTHEQIANLRREYWLQAQKRCLAQPDKMRFLDKLPLNIIDLSIINRIFPEALIITLIRDPRDVCLSCFMQLFEPSDAMANFYSLKSSAEFYCATMDLWLQYQKTLNLDFYQLRYEDLVDDFEPQVRTLLEFLGLDWDARVLNYHENRTHKISTPSYHDTCKPVFSRAIGRWRHYEKHLKPVMPSLQTYIERFGYEAP